MNTAPVRMDVGEAVCSWLSRAKGWAESNSTNRETALLTGLGKQCLIYTKTNGSGIQDLQSVTVSCVKRSCPAYPPHLSHLYSRIW